MSEYQAVALLVKLRDRAVLQDRLPEFQTRPAALQAQYAVRPAFQERLRKGWLEMTRPAMSPHLHPPVSRYPILHARTSCAIV